MLSTRVKSYIMPPFQGWAAMALAHDFADINTLLLRIRRDALHEISPQHFNFSPRSLPAGHVLLRVPLPFPTLKTLKKRRYDLYFCRRRDRHHASAPTI